MTHITVAVTEGEPIAVSATAFGSYFNEVLVHQAVVAYMAGARQGSKAQKSRADARGGGRKPWRQKRTGRARAGSIRSPLWRGGGRAFAARPRDHSVKLNRKMYRGAIRCIFSELVRQQRLLVAPSLDLEAPKTKALVSKLGALGLRDVLILVDRRDANLELAARNLPRVEVRTAAAVDPVALLRHENVLATVNAIRRVEEGLA